MQNDVKQKRAKEIAETKRLRRQKHRDNFHKKIRPVRKNHTIGRGKKK